MPRSQVARVRRAVHQDPRIQQATKASASDAIATRKHKQKGSSAGGGEGDGPEVQEAEAASVWDGLGSGWRLLCLAVMQQQQLL